MATSQCRQCGTEIVWDEKVRSSSGKMIPMEKSGGKHQCPFSKFNKTPDKTLGISPMEAVAKHEKEIAELKKRIDKIEIEMKWGQQSETKSEKSSDRINWSQYKTSEKNNMEALRGL